MPIFGENKFMKHLKIYQTFMTHNEVLRFLDNNDPISAKSAPQMLSLNVA